MEFKFLLILVVVLMTISVEGKKSGRSRGSGSGRGSSRKTNANPQPAPTSFSYPQQSAPKPSFSGWQEGSAQKTRPTQTHSYPSSGTGMSGNKPKQTPTNQEIQRSGATNNLATQQGHTNNQPSHSYPSSTGLSGGAGSGYPQQTGNNYPKQPNSGLSSNSGNNQAGYPQSPGSSLSGGQSGNTYSQQHTGGSGGIQQAPPPYSGYRPGNTNPQYQGQNNYGNNQYHPQGQPPAYGNVGGQYGGFGGHGHNPSYGSQMPGYFGNYGKGNGGLSRTGSALTGVGIAGAGIGTVLTGLALWNLARSTGRSHHTVVYDNRGQPVAVAPTNDTATDSFLADLVNCSLTMSNDNKTEVLAIPCAIASSFTPTSDVKDTGISENPNDNTKCTVTVTTKAGKEYMTTIPCSILLNTAAENNVTEPVIENDQVNLNNSTIEYDLQKGGNVNSTTSEAPPAPAPALRLTGENNDNFPNLNCTPVPVEIRDPINPCYSVNHNLTVIPLPSTEVPN